MNKAEKYLNERMNLMTDERDMLLIKIDETDLEIKEIEYKIRDLQNSIDDSFEIFSPRTRKNDFIKNEIECLEKEIETLTSLRDEYKEKIEKIIDDVHIIKDALRENIEDEDTLDVTDDEVNTDEIENENSISIVDLSNSDATGNYALYNNVDTEKIIIEKERLFIAGSIEEKTLQPISNLIHKCNICGRVLEVDTGRAKLEIEVMHKALNDLYENIKTFTGDLRKSVGGNIEPVKNVPVKKLSKDNFHKGN